MTSAGRLFSVTVKGMRLARPSFFIANKVACEQLDVPPVVDFANLAQRPESSTDFAEFFHSSQLFDVERSLVLANANSDVYLGVTYSAYVAITNHSLHDVTAVEAKIELISGQGNHYTLIDTKASPLAVLASSGVVGFSVSHRIGLCDEHVLGCSIAYSTLEGDRHSFSVKLDEFVVIDPLDVRAKGSFGSDAANMFLEVEVANSTAIPILLEEVKFVVADVMRDSISVDEYNPASFVIFHDRMGVEAAIEHEDSDLVDKLGAAASAMCVLPTSTRQYLYRLHRTGQSVDDKDVEVGSLTVRWRSTFGESSQYLTRPVTWKSLAARGGAESSEMVRLSYRGDAQQAHGMDISLVAVPSRILLEQPFVVSVRFRNLGSVARQLVLSMSLGVRRLSEVGVSLNGVSDQLVGEVAPHGAITAQLSLFPSLPGVQSLGGLGVIDKKSGTRFPFPADVTVFVFPEGRTTQLGGPP